ncbi:transporter [Dehalogenimonas sp. WBC-2]|nr:transporter [Dehalogenimonas sp. WBC-2]
MPDKLKSCDCADGTTQSATGNKGSSNSGLAAKLIFGLAAWGLLYYWLKPVADYVTYDLLNFGTEDRLGSAVAFFLYDAPKVLLLLVLIIFVVGIIRSFFTPEHTRRLIAGKSEITGNAMAASLGIVTPFCSCSACPLFIGFVEAGVPLGVTFSFLIASPMINEVALVLLYGLFGWKIAVIYIASGLFIAITAGWVIGKLKLERFIEDWVRERRSLGTNADVTAVALLFKDRVDYGLQAVKDITGKVWPYLLGGIAIGAFIHGYVPEDFLASIMGKNAWWSVPTAVIIGVPIYSNAAGVIPIVQALMEKGAALGTSLAFMMAVVGLSLPEMIILRKVLKWQLLAIFVGVVAVGIILVGYLFNVII